MIINDTLTFIFRGKYNHFIDIHHSERLVHLGIKKWLNDFWGGSAGGCFIVFFLQTENRKNLDKVFYDEF
jgi:hypothetical protein